MNYALLVGCSLLITTAPLKGISQGNNKPFVLKYTLQCSHWEDLFKENVIYFEWSEVFQWIEIA